MDLVTPPPPIVSLLPLGRAPQPAPAAPALQVGQIIDALVLKLVDATTVRLSLSGVVVDAKTTVPLDPGSTVRLAVQSSGSNLQLVIVGAATGAAGAGSALPGQPPSDPTVSIVPPGSEAVASTGGQVTIVDIAGMRTAPMPTAEQAIASTGPQPMAPAVAEAIQVAAARQGGLAPLLANVAQMVDSRAAPRPVLQAALDVLNLRVPLDGGLVAADVRQALAQSGLFLEARLAAATTPHSSATVATVASPGSAPGAGTAPGLAMALGQATVTGQVIASGQATASGPGTASVPATASGAATTPSTAPGGPSIAPSLADMVALPSGDLKAALLVFREVVKIWLDHPDLPTVAGTTAGPAALGTAGLPRGAPDVPARDLPELPVSGTAEPSRTPGLPPPPFHGDPPSAQPVAAPTLAAGAAPADVAQQLLTQTDAALARHTLMQVASLPDQPQAAGTSRADPPGPQWLFEIPFLTRQGTSLAQFEIGRDGRAVTADGRVIWRARFSLDVEPMGPVHVQVALLGERAAVTLWAEREASAAQLRASTPLLSEALRQAELEPGEIQCRAGAPAAPAQAAGRFLDRAS